ncbi:MAG: ankyrin repeat domain-containing protein [Magnetococcales bacterium]|nr:ankyrin repeat domain-containing protein [Magnetococcales bacterium]
MKIPGLEQLVPGLMLSSYIETPTKEIDLSNQESVHYSTEDPITQNPDASITLLDQGNRLDSMDLQGQTALMWAAMNGETAMASRLIRAGADVNATDWWGRTAFFYAANNNHRKIISLLIESGADLEL